MGTPNELSRGKSRAKLNRSYLFAALLMYVIDIKGNAAVSVFNRVTQTCP
jgi:hypothetical protein